MNLQKNISKILVLGLILFVGFKIYADFEFPCTTNPNPPPVYNCPVTTLPATNIGADVTSGVTTDSFVTLHGRFTLTTSTPAPTIAYFRLTTAFPNPPVFCEQIYGNNMISTEDLPLDPPYSSTSTTNTRNFHSQPLRGLGLEPSTVYYYCALTSGKIKNNQGQFVDAVYYGDVRSFMTLPEGCATPADCPGFEVATGPADLITHNSARLNGAYMTSILDTLSFWFEYGKDPALLTNVSSTTPLKICYPNNPNPCLGQLPKSASVISDLSGLTPDTEYFFRAILKKNGSSEKVEGDIKSFTTDVDPTTLVIVIDTPIQLPCLTDADCPTGQICQNNLCVTPGGPDQGPFTDAIVRDREGVEHVLYRQAVTNDPVLQYFGYDQSVPKENFSQAVSHKIAKIFGYVDPQKKEVRVKLPDIAAYVLRFYNGIFLIEEYLANQLLEIRGVQITPQLKPIRPFEYLFKKQTTQSP